MRTRGSTIALHLALITGLTTLIVLCAFYPFLPGSYDGLALALSAMAQLFGVTGLLLVPVGVGWWVYESRQRASPDLKRQNKHRYYFALASLIASSIVAAAVSLGAFISMGPALGFGMLALWAYIASRLKLLKSAETENFHFAPLYLTCLPVGVLLLQVLFASSATEFSRNYAIARSAELINDIEEHHAVHGRYPSSLLAVHKDYKPTVVGIEQFHYAAHGRAYNLFFEQPRFLFDNAGTREFVVYNKLDEHIMPSHANWILRWTPEVLATRQGWYAVHATSSPHWKYYWFD